MCAISLLLNRGDGIFKSRIAVECPNLDDAIPASAVSLERVLDGEGVTGNRASFVPVIFGIYVLDSRFFDSASLSLFVEIFR
jgi:hypothetical protein